VEALLPATSLLFLEEALTAVDARDVDAATTGVAGLCLVTLVATVAKLLRTGLSKRVAWSLAERLRRVAHGRMLEVPDGRTVGDRLALLSQEADQVQLGLSAAVTLVRDPVALLGLAVAAVWVAPTLALVTLLALVVVDVYDITYHGRAGEALIRHGNAPQFLGRFVCPVLVDPCFRGNTVGARAEKTRPVRRPTQGPGKNKCTYNQVFSHWSLTSLFQEE